MNIERIKKAWTDPVWSKIIASVIFAIVCAIFFALWAKIKSISLYAFLIQKISLSILEITIGFIATISLTYLLMKFRNRKKRALTIHERLDNEYIIFKTDKTFKHFDAFAKAANSRLHFDNFDRKIVDYYLAIGILFDSRPGHGYYILTNKGTHFFNKRAIEKVGKRKNPSS
jgi:hypothetical protein